jgi:hypothetical protein
MKISMSRAGLVLLIVLAGMTCLSIISEVRAEPTDKELIDEERRMPLKGVKGFYVLIESLGDEEKKDGLSIDTLQNAVQLKLRSSGILVVSKDEWIKNPEYLRLYINLNMLKLKSLSTYAYNMTLQIKEYVKLPRETVTFCHVTIWNDSYTGYVSGAKMPGKMKESVVELTEELANDYLAANPKK